MYCVDLTTSFALSLSSVEQMDCPELYVVVLQQLLSPDDPAATVNEQLANPHNRSEWRLRTVLMPVSINSSDHLHAYLSAF